MNKASSFVSVGMAILALGGSVGCSGDAGSDPRQASRGENGAGPGTGGADAGTDGTAPPWVSNPSRPSNEPPSARGETFFTPAGVPVALGDLLANDSDPDKDSLLLSISIPPQHGSLSKDASGNYLYTPTAGFIGEDRFTYMVDDGHGGTDTADVVVYAARNTYYVSPSGNDQNAGTSPSAAWKTAARIPFCSDGVRGGDVVLFERGATFRETLGNCSKRGDVGKPIVFGSYGSAGAPAPEFTGSDRVTTFTQIAGNIWKANIVGTVSDVYFNDKRQTPARMPNTGWYSNAAATAGQNIKVVKTPDLNGAAGAYVGANIHMRTVNWAFETKRIVASSPGQVTIDSNFTFDVTDGQWGYFLDGRLEYLDAAGEWFHDKAAGVLYFRTPDGSNPNNAMVEAVVRDKAIDLFVPTGQDAYLVIDGLTAKHAANIAIQLAYESRHFAVRHSTIRDSFYGLRVFMNDGEFVENVITRTLDAGAWIAGDRNTFSRNLVTDIAMVPGYGVSTWGYMGMNVYGNDSKFTRNVVDGTGYSGILLGRNVLAEGNYVRRACAILNDCDSIAFDQTDGLVIRKNVVTEPLGSLDAVSPAAGPGKSPYERIVFGIRFGNISNKNVVIEDNVVDSHQAGLAVDHTLNSAGNAIRDNLLFNNIDGQMIVGDDSAPSCRQSYGETYTGNIMVAGGPSQPVMYHRNVKCPTPVDWGTFDQNRYLSAYGSNVIKRDQFPDSTQYSRNFTLPQWQAQSGQDKASRTLPSSVNLSDEQKPVLHLNRYGSPRKISVTGAWVDMDGNAVTGLLEIPAFSGVVLFPK